MTITSADIRFLASERMTDDADGGGRMTATAVQSGVDNNVWPDLSSVDRARGAIELRKVYLAALAATTDALMDAHVIVERRPADSAVSVFVTAAADLAETRSTVLDRLHTAPLYGAAVLTAPAAVDTTALALDTTSVQVVPMVQSVAAVTGALNDADNTRPVWIDTGVSLAVPVAVITGAGGSFPVRLDWPAVFAAFGAGVVPGSVAGTVQTVPVVTTLASNDRQLLSTRGGTTVPADYSTSTPRSDVYFDGLPGTNLAGAAVTAGLALNANLPVQRARLTVTAANRALVYALAVPVGTMKGSECARHLRGAAEVGVAWGQFSTPNARTTSGTLQAVVDRSGGSCTLILQALPEVGDVLEVSYCAPGATADVPSTALSATSFNSGGHVTLTLPAGQSLATAVFKAGGTWVELRGLAVSLTDGSVVGGFDPATGVLSAPSLASLAITEWACVATLASAGMSDFSGTVPALMAAGSLQVSGTTVAGVAFTAAADSLGVFATTVVSGSYTPASGALVLTFATPVRAGTLAYSASQRSYLPSAAGLGGLTASRFPADGRRPLFRTNDVVVLQHSAETSPGAVSVGQVIDCGRADLAAAVVVDANGAVFQTGFAADLAAGLVTIASVVGWTPPVRVRHTIEHVAVVSGAVTELGLSLNRPLARAFPAGSVLSSALMLGDLQARAGAGFSQLSWTAVWQDTRIGDPITAQYDQAAHPVELRDDGAVTEDWAFIFTSGAAFRCVGRRLGQVATGDINSVFAPINPATGQPYFTVRPAGWGGGWSGGNVWRLPTLGANGPLWACRVTLPSAPAATSDSAALAGRGDVNT